MPDSVLQVALLAGSLLLGLSGPAWSQAAQVVPNCAGVTAVAEQGGRLAVDQFGRLCTNPGFGVAGTNRSATVGLTAAPLMAANAARRGWRVRNDCANSVWINFDGAAAATAGAGNIKIAAGAMLTSEPGYVETGAMSAIAELSVCTLTAREY